MSAIARLLEAAPRYAALLRSQYWPPKRLESYREQHLERTLAAARRIPFYAERLSGNPRPADLAHLPILRRADVEALNQSMRSLYAAGTRFVHSSSSATSGSAADFVFDRSHQNGRHAARARFLRAHGWNPFERTAWLVGQVLLETPYDPFDHDLGFISRVFAGVRFIPNWQDFREQVARLTEMRPRYLYLYPSILDGILRVLEQTRQNLPSLRKVFTGAEVLDDSIRERVRRQLGVQIADNYGSTEAFIAWQCPRGSYHLNAEHVMIEIVDETGREVAAGESGRVLVTTLENYLMPLLRYEIGDYAIASVARCGCGRTLPVFGRVLGRAMNLFRKPDGSYAPSWMMINHLRKFDMKQFQIVQKLVDSFVIRYVAAGPLSLDAQAQIHSELSTLMGYRLSIGFELVNHLARTPAGKFMLTMSELPNDLPTPA
jgi:phenylacetate-CoA ligase